MEDGRWKMKIKNRSWRKSNQTGFTLPEVIIGLAVISLLIYYSTAAFIRMQTSRLLTDNVWQVVSVLRQLQVKTSSGEASNDQHLKFGVFFTTTGFREFRTLSDYASREQAFDFVNSLPLTLRFTEFVLPNTCQTANDCVIFESALGIPSGSGRVSLENTTTTEKRVIQINSQGAINY